MQSLFSLIFGRGWLVMGFLLLCFGFNAHGSTKAKRPNILLFLVDDMGVMDTSQAMLTDEAGELKSFPLNAFYRTPNMERLASTGVIFSQFYANSVCSPSRVSLLNGQSSARHRVTQWIKPSERNEGPDGWRWEGIGSEDVSLPKVLKEHGYQTIFCGKGHFAPTGYDGADPRDLGFDVNIGGTAIGHPGSYYGEKNYAKADGAYAVPGLDAYHGSDTFLSEALTLELKKAMDEAVEIDKPFFIDMSHYAVHAPFESDPRFVKSYKNAKSKHAAFASLIEGMDKSLGDLLDHLEALGVAEETLVIFLGDNGSDAPIGQKSEHKVASSAPLRGKKGSHYEGGMRVPFIASWAKVSPEGAIQKRLPIRQGVVNSDFATIEDVFPTLLVAAGVGLPDGHVVDGHDLWPYFSEHQGTRPQQFLMHFPHKHRSSYYTMLRSGDWKLVYHYRRPAAKAMELFNLKQDPNESKNVVSREKDIAQAMLKVMREALIEAKALPCTDMKGRSLLPGDSISQ